MAGELVLLTGGTGFVGCAILVELLKSGYRVRVAARSQAKIDKVLAAPSISSLGLPANQLTFVIVPDMVADGAYDGAVRGVDFVIHAAAPIHGEDKESSLTKEQLEEALVATSVKGNLSILEAAMKKGRTVRRVVMTSSTVAIAPPYFCITGDDVLRGPDSRVAIAPPPYESQLHAYCAGKAAALRAAEEFVEANSDSIKFDLISIMPSLVFGEDELATGSQELMTRSGSTAMLISGLLSGKPSPAAIGNAVLCRDVARAHVRALNPAVAGNQSFVLDVAIRWEDTIPIAKKYFPDAFGSGLFEERDPQPTIPVRWDASKAQGALGINFAGYDVMVKEVVAQYLELVKGDYTLFKIPTC
ncbi:hypothetical protein BX600DRAFT_514316 [Xylariales sp. PMI_506]|nr:hypothetical protein BX600DRAFT_514316 [Xylariales sp. PMI_506]